MKIKEVTNERAWDVMLQKKLTGANSVRIFKSSRIHIILSEYTDRFHLSISNNNKKVKNSKIREIIADVLFEEYPIQELDQWTNKQNNIVHIMPHGKQRGFDSKNNIFSTSHIK
ncbi:DUF1827 family protein [Listeria fleischmannii]|uniref:Uncharacterized protein n=1 Tax=Listeria fleischmannii FSL S10-1203 TaxID=1265822 RepID=W7DMP5_9LIST|nr:DUF1827 family protein [Listeria fleischmannii]EUJ53827.1 hypothetical protein MCOL2_10480 [Listeria fleischmannii FSL S10-1203]